MPNSRRRKFSVKNSLKSQHVPLPPTAVQSGMSNKNIDVITSSKPNIVMKTDSRDKSFVNTRTLKIPCLEIQPIVKAPNTVLAIAKHISTANKDVTTSSSTQDFSKFMDTTNSFISSCDKCFNTDENTTKFSEETSTQKPLVRRERHARQHRIKIRGTRTRNLSSDNNRKTALDNSIAVNTEESQIMAATPPIESVANAYINIDSLSSESVDDMCRICHSGERLSQELGNLISACSCRGTVGRVHVRCLERWLTESGKSRCELCGIRYTTRRVHRYGVPRALVMWILSHNAKQLMVDTLGIMLMSPLAVLAAWLSGRTLSTLISQENHASPAPWPLASTFVLACMTLVCYYCWIVSAATRHALSWWIWYRSQYEVRLQLHDDSDD